MSRTFTQEEQATIKKLISLIGKVDTREACEEEFKNPKNRKLYQEYIDYLSERT